MLVRVTNYSIALRVWPRSIITGYISHSIRTWLACVRDNFLIYFSGDGDPLPPLLFSRFHPFGLEMFLIVFESFAFGRFGKERILFLVFVGVIVCFVFAFAFLFCFFFFALPVFLPLMRIRPWYQQGREPLVSPGAGAPRGEALFWRVLNLPLLHSSRPGLGPGGLRPGRL